MCWEEVSTVGDKEWYFFCIRGRKYRNSIRPNRVTGSGFWKATGIDKPIYSSSKQNHQEHIGLKKSLVYYKGSAGKGTKTDWMMHEFRLPPNPRNVDNKDLFMAQEAVSSLFFFFFSKVWFYVWKWFLVYRKYGHYAEYSNESRHTKSTYPWNQQQPLPPHHPPKPPQTTNTSTTLNPS